MQGSTQTGGKIGAIADWAVRADGNFQRGKGRRTIYVWVRGHEGAHSLRSSSTSRTFCAPVVGLEMLNFCTNEKAKLGQPVMLR